MNEPTDANDPAKIPESSEKAESHNTAQAFLESQLDEYNHIKKMIRFVRKNDELDRDIALAIEKI